MWSPYTALHVHHLGSSASFVEYEPLNLLTIFKCKVADPAPAPGRNKWSRVYFKFKVYHTSSKRVRSPEIYCWSRSEVFFKFRVRIQPTHMRIRICNPSLEASRQLKNIKKATPDPQHSFSVNTIYTKSIIFKCFPMPYFISRR